MEVLMKKAITEFKKMKLGEIRSVCVYEMNGAFGKALSGLFHIEYCSAECADYKEIDIYVSK